MEWGVIRGTQINLCRKKVIFFNQLVIKTISRIVKILERNSTYALYHAEVRGERNLES